MKSGLSMCGAITLLVEPSGWEEMSGGSKRGRSITPRDELNIGERYLNLSGTVGLGEREASFIS